MSLKCGIVGMPNVGKSTLFNLLTKANVKVANYPFCTIEPSAAVVSVKDERIDVLALMNKSKNVIYSTVEFVDIAGLVKGASKGAGLGNKFLSHIHQVDLIIHVVRTFEDSNIIHVGGRVDPAADLEIINTELKLADLKTVENYKKKNPSASLLEKQILEDKIIADTLGLNLLTVKPVIILCNGAVPAEIQEYCNKFNIFFLGFNFCNENSEQLEGDLNNLIKVCFKKLNLISFFTTGLPETRAWTTPSGSTAVEAAGKIHSDFVKHFIRAECLAYEDYIINKSMQMVKKDYVVRDGDVMYFHVSC